MATKLEIATERAEAIERLSDWVKPGDTVHTILRHVSRSGMQRAISLIVTHNEGPYEISYLAARAMGDKIDQNHGGIKISGCGMDMGFALVYNLGRTLFSDWECIGDGCPANDHHNPPYPQRVAGSMTHKDGGYALEYRWL